MWATPVPYDNGVTPGTASTFAGILDPLLVGMFVASCLVLVGVMLAMFGLGIGYRRGKPANRQLPLTTVPIEITWILLPALAFFGFFIWGAWVYQVMFRPPRNSYVVGVVAKQWMWKFEHPDGQLEIDQLHVPLGRPVKLVMTSEDVIHSLGIPAFRTKHDILPGRYQQMWFEATRVGAYHLFCDQYCGTLHARMIGRVIVMSPRDFARWSAQGRPDESMALQGRRYFQQYGCAGCHGESSSVHAPRFEGLYGKPVTLVDGRRKIVDESYIQGCILHPYTQYVAGYPPIMPSFQGQLSQAKILDLIAYIRQLGDRPAPGE